VTIKGSVLTLACALLLSPVARAQAPAAAARVYTGPDGVTVAIVARKGAGGQPDDKTVLIQVTGSRSEFDGKAIPHEVVDNGNGSINYTTKVRGRTYVTIPVRGGRYELYVPGHGGDPIRVSYDEKKSQALKAEEVSKLYDKQRADGTLARLQSFDRKAEMAANDKELRAAAGGVDKACGGKLAVEVKWASIVDDDIMTVSVSGYCGAPLTTMQTMCGSSAEAKQAIATRVQTFTCLFGKAPAFELTGTTLTWTATRDATNLAELTRAFLDKKLTAPITTGTRAPAPPGPPATAGDAPPWGHAETLGERTTLEKTTVCTDGRSHYVVVAPHDLQSRQLYYGDGKRFFHVPLPDGALSGDNFFEPRFFAASHNANFRGVDTRLYGSVDLDPRTSRCAVTCGDRTAKLEMLGPEAKKSLLLRASYEASPHRRKPHHLARDKAGIYYYVDRGSTPDNEKDFRLFVGPKGQMKLQKMVNVVADTQGEIFETKGGSLRYIVPRRGDAQNPPLWVKGRKETPLTVIPIETVDAQSGEKVSNYGLIYNDLGVYLGTPLGNPCDDL
jgi:hypothetical protein